MQEAFCRGEMIMSKYFSNLLSSIKPYTPGEQPDTNSKYIKLNTNESPFPPREEIVRKAEQIVRSYNLYSDPSLTMLRESIGKCCGVEKECITCSNGSDELLLFSFLAFGDREKGIVSSDITYSFYSTLTALLNIPLSEVQLDESFKIQIEELKRREGTIVIANPNAPTGIALKRDEIESLVSSNQNRIVIVDEAYVDFGGESSISLTKKYPNLVVIKTFSKSLSLAGLRLGYAISNEELINDIERVRTSINPYNINSFSLTVGSLVIQDKDYNEKNIKTIIQNRENTSKSLKELGFDVLDSSSNFLFISHKKLNGDELYQKLKQRGVLIRHFDKDRIKNWNRVSIGKKEDMDEFIRLTKEILDEKK